MSFQRPVLALENVLVLLRTTPSLEAVAGAFTSSTLDFILSWFTAPVTEWGSG